VTSVVGEAATTGSPVDGMLVGTPRRWLRVEGGTLLAGSLIAYSTTDQACWLVPLTLLLPDLTMIGYLGGTRLGSYLYNLGHSTPIPFATGCDWLRPLGSINAPCRRPEPLVGTFPLIPFAMPR
jgi:hypothetical protein